MNNIEKEKFNPEENEKWTASKESKEEEQISSEKGEWTPTVEEGEKTEKESKEVEEEPIEEKEEIVKEIIPEKEKLEQAQEELNEEYIKVEETKKNIEQQEIDNWYDLQRKGLLTEKAEEIFNGYKETNLRIADLTRELSLIRPDIERYHKEEEEGKKIKESMKEDRQRIISRFKQKEKELKESEDTRKQLINQMRELEQRGELVKKVEPEKEEEVSEEVEAPEEKEEEKPKGFLGRFRRKK